MRLILPLFLLFTLTIISPLYADQSAATMLTKEKAVEALHGIRGEVVNIHPAEVPGLFQVDMKMQGKVVPIYLDAKGEYLISGNVIRIKDRKNLTQAAFQKLNPVDISGIPVEDALILGDPKAEQKVIVFTDPHCPFCSKYHKVLHEVVKSHPKIAFYIKLVPFKPSSKQITQTILCNNSMEQLEKAFAGESLPEPACESDVIGNNLMLANKLGINGTPSSILPNGIISPGYKSAEELVKAIKENQAVTE